MLTTAPDRLGTLTATGSRPRTTPIIAVLVVLVAVATTALFEVWSP